MTKELLAPDGNTATVDACGPSGGITRRVVLRAVASAAMLPWVSLHADTAGGQMEIKRSGSQPSVKGPAEWFTGTVRIDPLFDAPLPGRGRHRHVRARSAYGLAHASARPDVDCHLRGRQGTAMGRTIEDIRPGDVVWIPPGEKHWHGASPTTAMTHIAIQERLDVKASTGWSM